MRGPTPEALNHLQERLTDGVRAALGKTKGQSRTDLEIEVRRVTALAAAMTCLLAEEDDVRALGTGFARLVLAEAAAGGVRDIGEWPTTLFKQGVAMLRSCGRLRDLQTAGHPQETVAECVAYPLGQLFNHAARIRIYSIDLSSSQYRGYLTVGMPASYGTTTQVPIHEPPYAEVPETTCGKLTAASTTASWLAQLPEATRRWYTTDLGLGTVVPETYTWHLMESGPVRYDQVRSAALPSPPIWALSFDLGASNGADFNSRVCSILQLRTLDLLLREGLGAALAIGLERTLPPIQGTVRAESPRSEPGQPAEPHSLPTTRNAPHRNSQRPEKPIRKDEIPLTLRGTFDCFPGRLPWVFDPTDASARLPPLKEAVESFVDLRGVGSVLFYGPSGAGKDRLAHIIHEGSGRGGVVIKATIPTDVLARAIELKGCPPGTFTGQSDGAARGVDARKPSIFERAGGGVVLFSDFIKRMKDSGEVYDDILEIVGSVLDRDAVVEHQGTRRYVPSELIVATGPADSLEHLTGGRHSDWFRRFQRHVYVPGWQDLGMASRRAILRWYLLELAANAGARTLSLAGPIFRELMSEGAGNPGNMSAIANRVRSLPRYREDDTLFVGERTEDSVELGGPSFEDALLPIERLALEVARCSERESGHVCAATRLIVAQEDFWGGAFTSKEACLDGLYLLGVAGAVSVGPGGTDAYGVQPSNYQNHIPGGKQAPLNHLLKKWFEATATEFRGPDDKSSAAGAHFNELVKHVAGRARELQAAVERIACAYPPFFHVVPMAREGWDRISMLHSRMNNPSSSSKGAMARSPT